MWKLFFSLLVWWSYLKEKSFSSSWIVCFSFSLLPGNDCSCSSSRLKTNRCHVRIFSIAHFNTTKFPLQSLLLFASEFIFSYCVNSQQNHNSEFEMTFLCDSSVTQSRSVNILDTQLIDEKKEKWNLNNQLLLKFFPLRVFNAVEHHFNYRKTFLLLLKRFSLTPSLFKSVTQFFIILGR